VLKQHAKVDYKNNILIPKKLLLIKIKKFVNQYKISADVVGRFTIESEKDRYHVSMHATQ